MVDKVLGRIGAVATGLGILLAIATLTPATLQASASLVLAARVIAVILIVGGLLAMVEVPVRAALGRYQFRSPVERRGARKVFSGTTGPPIAIPPVPIEAFAKREFTSASLDQLLDPFRAMSTLQARQVIQAYVGKWLSLEGQLSEVVPTGRSNELQVTLMGRPAYLMFTDEESTHKLRLMSIGEPLVAIGVIQEINQSHVLLAHCELSS